MWQGAEGWVRGDRACRLDGGGWCELYRLSGVFDRKIRFQWALRLLTRTARISATTGSGSLVDKRTRPECL